MTQNALPFAGAGAIAPQSGLRGAHAVQQAIQTPLEAICGWSFGFLAVNDPKAYKRAIARTADLLADLAEVQIKATYDSLGFERAAPDKRWAFYTQAKTVDMWAGQKAKYPRDFEEDRKDLEKLAKQHVEDGTISMDGAVQLLAQADGVAQPMMPQQAPVQQAVA